MRLFLIIITSFIFASCSSFSYQPRLTEAPGGYGSQEYQECIDKNPEDKTKCDMIKPYSMEPNLTEHREKEGYH